MNTNRTSQPPLYDAGPGTRCPKHDLVRGPTGECILCRKAREERERIREKKGRILVPALSILGLLGASGVIAYQVFLSPPPAAAISQKGNAGVQEGDGQRAGRSDDAPGAQGEELPESPVRRPNVETGGDGADGQQETGVPEEKKSKKPDKHEIAAAMRLVSVNVYYAESCPVCRKALAHMQEEGISYNGHDIKRNSFAKQELATLNPRKSVPTFKIDDEVMVGFSAGRLRQVMERAAMKRARENRW